VVLGNDCIVGSNSVVTKSFPDKSIIGGIPAKLIGLNE
jgi:acetyltransferase-like isoleucine patch superfamily enzyme